MILNVHIICSVSIERQYPVQTTHRQHSNKLIQVLDKLRHFFIISSACQDKLRKVCVDVIFLLYAHMYYFVLTKIINYFPKINLKKCYGWTMRFRPSPQF